MLKYFREYWETKKIFLSHISNNEIIPDENFPDYGILVNDKCGVHKLCTTASTSVM